MKNILFVSSVNLKNPMRGTPLRIYNFLQQIGKENNLFICCQDIDDHLKKNFIFYPQYRGIKKIKYFLDIIKDKKIDIVFVATETGIKLPIILKIFTNIKIAIDLHGLSFEELYYKKAISWGKKIYLELMIRFYLCFYDLIFVAADNLKIYYKFLEKKISVIYGGVNLSEFPYNFFTHDEQYLIVGYMGNSRPYQGLDYLLTALQKIKENKIFPFRLNLVLSGEKETEVKEKLISHDLIDEANLNLDVAHSLVNDIINKSDVLVIPRPSISVTEYAFPSKLPEYLATGIPIIISAVGPVNYMFQDNSCCIIVKTDDVENNLKQALTDFSHLSLAERKNIGLNAFQYANNNLTWEVIGKKINKDLTNL